MNVICNKRFFFQDEVIGKNLNGDVVVASVKESFTLEPSKNVQQAPEWIKGTDLYKLARKDKSIVEVAVVTPIEDDIDPVTVKTAPPQEVPVVPETGWGVGPQPPTTTAPNGTLKG